MRQIADNLKEQLYIDRDNVEAIRKYIRVKNPSCSEEEISVVFADALHRIIDSRIYQFEEKHRKKIKAAVLKKAVKKSEFSINASEVFSSCLALKLQEDSYIQSFTQWINQNQPIPVSANEVDRLVASVEQLDGDYIENNLDDIVDEFEYSWAEDKTFEVLGIEINETAMYQTNVQILETPVENPAAILDTEESKWLDEIRELIDIKVSESDNVSSYMNMEQQITEVRQEVVTEAEYHGSVLESEVNTNRYHIDELFSDIGRLAATVSNSFKALKPSRKLLLQGAMPLAIITVLAFTGLPGYDRIQGLKYQGQGRYADIAEDQLDRHLSLESRILDKLDGLTGKRALVLLDGLHGELKYETVDQGKLKKWLVRKDSMLAEEPYFTAILETSKKYDIHPVLMFAIVGQEQGFVPKSGAAAKKIANNPFNVYGSWEKYNTDIYDSSRLAASTIIESSRNRPAYMNTIRWINRRYAEDPNWWNGVSSLFDQIKKEMTIL